MSRQRKRFERPWAPFARSAESRATLAASGRARATSAGVGWTAIAFLALLACYWTVFYTTPLPIPGSDEPLLRAEYQWPLLLRPEDLAATWMGEGGSPLGLADRGPVLLAAAAILATALALGLLLIERFGAAPGLSPLELFVMGMGVGLNALSLGTLAAGLLGGLHHRLLLAGLAGVVILLAVWRGVCGRFGLSKATGNPGASAAAGGTDGLHRWTLLLAAPFLVIILLGAMLPPWEFDVREYHLQAPKEWCQQGSVGFLPHNVYGNMPLGAEMHALLAMAAMPGELAWWWGALAGKTVIAAFAPLTALALVAIGQRFFTPAAGVVASLVYISIPWVAHVSMAGLIEGAVAFYLLLAVYALLLWRSEDVSAAADENARDRGRVQSDTRDALKRRRGRLLLAGFLAGSAVACKYPAMLFVVAPLAAWVLLDRWLRRPTERSRAFLWRPAAVFLLAALCGCGLWLGKNAALCGNPVYPLLCEWFGPEWRTPEQIAQWTRAHRPPRDAEGRRYCGKGLADSIAQVGWRSEWLSPLPIPLAALALLAPRHRRLLLILLVLLAYIFATWWMATHRIDRFWLPALPILALLAGVGATWTDRRGWRRLIVAVLALGMLSNFLVIASPVIGDNRYFVTLEQLRSDEPKAPGDVSRVNPAHRDINETVPEGWAVLLVGDAQPFDLEVASLYNTCFDDCIFERLMKGYNKEQRMQALRERRISHIFFHWSEIDRYRATYGFTDYVTKSLVHKELAEQQGILRKIPLDLPPDFGELFQVVVVGAAE